MSVFGLRDVLGRCSCRTEHITGMSDYLCECRGMGELAERLWYEGIVFEAAIRVPGADSAGHDEGLESPL